MKRYITLACSLLFSLSAIGQDNYDASLIPKELLPYASAVVRNQQTTVEVKDFDNTVYYIKTAITILNKNGNNMADIVVWHNKGNIIKSIKGTIYNQFGKLTGKFSESNFEDVNTGASYTLFEDSKVKHYNPPVTDYPYTIVYEYEVKSKQSLNFNDWEPNSSTGVAVEKSSYIFSCKPDFAIRYKEFNMPGKVAVGTNTQGLKTFTWQVNNLKAVKDEPYSPNRDQYLTKVKIAPEKFSYEGITGSFTNWKELGKWQYDKLLSTRLQLPEQTAARMKELTASVSDPKLKAKKIYEYMQDKTHYISVQIGIGGYQPFLAADVDQQNYGDCKALVNYTQALLKTVNIDSYYCVVEAGSRKVSLLNDFASMDQGNHIILCLPFKNDTTFLECTSQQIPFGFLSDFTDDRTVLACTPEGGKLLHTPKYTAAENIEKRKATFKLSETGELTGTMTTEFKGTDYDDRGRIMDETHDEQIKSLKKAYAINNLDIEKADLKEFKSEHPYTVENIQLAARDYGSVSDGKLSFTENTANRLTTVPHEVHNRHNDVYINRGYTELDEISYSLPANYHVDLRPENITIEKPFGRLIVTTALKDNELTYTRKLELFDGTYNKEVYDDLVGFFQKVMESDDNNITLAKGN